MSHARLITLCSLGIAVSSALIFTTARIANAHCDTLDGPVIQDARKAIDAKEITPILKWVKPKDEKAVRAAFGKLLTTRAKNPENADKAFLSTLVKIHRVGEGASFTGLKPAGSVEPAVAEADRALAAGSADELVKLIADDVAAGIRKRYDRAAAAYKVKDESVAQGREFVEAYVAYTHYVERLHRDAIGADAHGEHAAHAKGEKRAKHLKGAPHSEH